MYGKFFSSAFTGSMMASGANVFAVWGYVIAHAVDSRVELNPRLLAAVIGSDIKSIISAIETLCAPDAESRSKVHEGRRLIREGEFQYFVTGHAKYRAMRDESDRREYNRVKKAESRARSTVKTMSNGLSIVSANTEAEAEADTEADTDTKKEKTLRKRSNVPSVPDGVSEKVWGDWLSVRKDKKAAVTDTAIEIIKAEADKAGYTMQQALETCCSRGWSGFKAAWVAETSKGQNHLPSKPSRHIGFDTTNYREGVSDDGSF